MMPPRTVDSIFHELTLEEKLTVLSGESTWRTPAISRLGIPKLKVSDGPSGARGEIYGENIPAAFLPCGVSLGATWDVELMHRLGKLLAAEVRQTFLIILTYLCTYRHLLDQVQVGLGSSSPTICIHRHPLGGRNFESFSEDPYLTGKLAAAHITGLQSEGIGACAKHFVANDQETNRFHVDARISPRALREVYLLPFQMAVRDAKPWTIMASYNKVNGMHCDMSSELMTDIARGEWGYDGMFISDWGGTNSTVESINAGLDLEMPGPPVRRAKARLNQEVQNGTIDLKAVDISIRRLLQLIEKSRKFQTPDEHPEKYVPTMPPEVVMKPTSQRPGALLEWHRGHDLTSDVVATQHINEDVYYISFGNTPPELPEETGFSFRLTTILRPRTTGCHAFSFASIGPASMHIAGKEVSSIGGDFEKKSTLFFTFGSPEHVFTMDMVTGQAYNIATEYRSHDRQLRAELVDCMDPMENKFQSVRIGYQEAVSTDLQAEAAELACGCDAAIVVVGRDKEWETEGQDIPTFELPGDQVRLIEAVAAASKRTIVIVQAGSPVQMEPWISKVQAVLYSWYQGQELGNAATSVISGDFNPSGRLPVTFPRRIEDCPAFSSFPEEQGTTVYADDLFVGYRWWDLLCTTPQFPIGFGLSYNSFALSNPRLGASQLLPGMKAFTLSITVVNTGGSALPGRQTVIGWCSQLAPRRLKRPVKQICAFSKSPPLQSGESCEIDLTVELYALGMYDPVLGSWVIDAGSLFEMLVGTTSLDAVVAGVMEVPDEISWIHEM